MSAPRPRSGPLVGLLLLVAIFCAGVAAFLIVDQSLRSAGVAAAIGSVALVTAGVRARGARWTFLDAIAYRTFDAVVLAAVAWEARPDEPAVAAAALVSFAGGFMASYFVNRGRALGYSIWGSAVNRTLRCALLVGALLSGNPGPWLWTLAAVSVATAIVRASQAFKEERV